MKRMTVSLLSVLLPIVSGCASPSLSVTALPQSAKPQAPAELMKREPSRQSSYQQQLSAAFETSPKVPTAK